MYSCQIASAFVESNLRECWKNASFGAATTREWTPGAPWAGRNQALLSRHRVVLLLLMVIATPVAPLDFHGFWTAGITCSTMNPLPVGK